MVTVKLIITTVCDVMLQFVHITFSYVTLWFLFHACFVLEGSILVPCSSCFAGCSFPIFLLICVDLFIFFG